MNIPTLRLPQPYRRAFGKGLLGIGAVLLVFLAWQEIHRPTVREYCTYWSDVASGYASYRAQGYAMPDPETAKKNAQDQQKRYLNCLVHYGYGKETAAQTGEVAVSRIRKHLVNYSMPPWRFMK